MAEPSYTVPCRACGRVPTKKFTIRRHEGMLIVQRFINLRQPFCRDHAQYYAKQYLGKTLWMGWWGLISFFVNIFVVIADVVVIAAAGKMPAPQAPAEPAVDEVTPAGA